MYEAEKKMWRAVIDRALSDAIIKGVNMQLYIACMNLDENPSLFTALNKDTSELYHELIPFDPEAAQRYSDRAVQIIKATENNELLPCISSDSSFYKCKMRGFRGECFGGER